MICRRAVMQIKPERLDSWKEIAAYLNRGIRTVQRWEHDEGLPVHRLPHDKKGSVYGIAAELDGWWAARGKELGSVPDSEPPGVRTGFGLRVSRPSLWVVGTLVVIGATTAYLVFKQPDSKVPRVVALTAFPGVEQMPAISPDGSRVAFSWMPEEGWKSDICVLVPGTSGPPLLLTSRGTNLHPAWSPDGRFVSFIHPLARERSELIIIPALGGTRRRLAEIETAHEMPWPVQAWTPDGRWIVTRDRPSPAAPIALVAISVESGERRQLTYPPADSPGDGAPVLSRDGRTLAFVRCGAGYFGRICVQPFSPEASTAHAKVLTGPRNIRSLVSGWDGRHLLFIEGPDGFSRLWRLQGNQDAQAVPGFGVIGRTASLSRDGRLIYDDYRTAWDIARMDLAPAGSAPVLRPLIVSSKNHSFPRISPDGSKIAVTSLRTGAWEIWITDSDGQYPVQLTFLGACRLPRWSPDGTRLAFEAEVDGKTRIYTIDAGGGKPRPVTDGRTEDTMPSWSRDGAFVYFTSNRGGQNQVWKMPAAGGTAVQVTRGTGLNAQESPDGRYVYFAREWGFTSVWRTPSSGGPEERVVENLAAPLDFEIRPQGIYCVQRPASPGAGWVQFYSFEGGQTQRFELARVVVNGYSFSPDGRWLVFSMRGRSSADLLMVENFR
jgi:eukaryotic-like serine/threonine-protein kinase